MEDKAIVDLFWNRDESAVRELSSKYSGYCYKIAWNILENHEDAEECVNDTWLASWQYIPPKRPGVLSAFVGKITRGFAIDSFRKQTADKRPQKAMQDICVEMDQLNFSYSIDDEIAEKELMKTINQFVRQLSRADRDIFIRRYWYMDSIKDIAKRHGVSESCIKTNLHRNRKKLYHKLTLEVLG